MRCLQVVSLRLKPRRRPLLAFVTCFVRPTHRSTSSRLARSASSCFRSLVLFSSSSAVLILNMFCQYIYLWMYVVPAADL